MQLTKWARQQGLTSKPMRPRRTRAEILEGAENTRPPACRPVARTGVEKMLKNPFYIGKLRHGDAVVDGNHEPLIDVRLFNEVQRVMQARCTSLRYDQQKFFTYQGLLRCVCGRSYSPYEKKGHAYYRSPCKPNCLNAFKNLSERQLDAVVLELLDACQLDQDELDELEASRRQQTAEREREAEKYRRDSERRLKRVQADLAYLKKERVTLLRTGVYAGEDYAAEVLRLEAEADEVRELLEAPADPAAQEPNPSEFSELLKTAQQSYESALAQEKRELCILAVSELVVVDQKLAGLSAKPGFARLLERGVGPVGSPKGNRTPVFRMKT